MNIAVITEYFHPAIGGINTHVFESARRMVRRGHRVTVHTCRYDPSLAARDRIDGIGVRRYGAMPGIRRFGGFFPEVDADADLVHLHDWFLVCHEWFFSVAGRHPVVLTPHGALSRPLLIQHHPFLRLLHAGFSRRFRFHRLHTIIAMTPWEMHSIRVRPGLSGARIEVIPNGVCDALLDAPAGEARGRYLFSLGRLAKGGWEDVVGILPRFPDLEYWIAGPPSGQEEPLRALARRLGVESRIRCLGVVSEPEKQRLMDGALCLVLLTRFEAQGIVLLEAMARGTPVIAAGVGGVPETVAHGEDGFLVDRGDADALARCVDRLRTDADLCRRMGRQASLKVRARHRWDDIAARTEAVYQAAGGKGKR